MSCSAEIKTPWGLTASILQGMCKLQVGGRNIGTCCRGPSGRLGGIKSKRRATCSRLVRGSRYRRKTGNFFLRVLKKDTGYPGSGLFLRGLLGSVTVYQTATKDAKAPSAKVIFLDATSGVAETRSSDVSEKDHSWEISIRRIFERLTVFPRCSSHPSWSSRWAICHYHVRYLCLTRLQ
jgi:hypothetical protein